MKKETSLPEKEQDKMISRKAAFQKAGKYAAFTAATMMMLLSPATSAVAQNSGPQRAKGHRR